MIPKALCAILLLIFLSPVLVAQRSDTIIANPKAQKLRVIWKIEGSQAGETYVGAGVGGLGDIFGTGYGAWAMLRGRQWQVFQGGPEPLSVIPVWTLWGGAGDVPYPVVGDFFGSGHEAVGFVVSSLEGAPFTDIRYRLVIYRTDSNRIADSAAAVWDSWKPGEDSVRVYVTEARVLDIDNDGYDDLALSAGVTKHGNERSTKGEIWIYRGGPHFQLDTPSVVIRDDEDNRDEQFRVELGRLDTDSIADMMIGVRYPGGFKIKFFRGKRTPQLFGSVPDRVLPVPNGFTVPSSFVLTCDCDGDHRLDLTGVGFGDSAAIYIWRSNTGKDPFTRSFNGNDADNRLPGPGIGGGVGYLNDSARRFEVLGNGVGAITRFYSGGPHGPNTSYDAYYDPREDGLGSDIVGPGGPIRDVDNNGWDDYILGNPQYTTFGPNQGIALILAGGPYIPFDTAASGVEQVPAEGHTAGLVLYPNPVQDDLHIAWRGDLKHMPARFEAYNARGERVAGGVVDSWRGEALWEMGELPAGVYMLTVYDRDGMMVATAEVVKK